MFSCAKRLNLFGFSWQPTIAAFEMDHHGELWDDRLASKTMLWVHSFLRFWRPDSRTDDLKNMQTWYSAPPHVCLQFWIDSSGSTEAHPGRAMPSQTWDVFDVYCLAPSLMHRDLLSESFYTDAVSNCGSATWPPKSICVDTLGAPDGCLLRLERFLGIVVGKVVRNLPKTFSFFILSYNHCTSSVSLGSYLCRGLFVCPSHV